MPTHNRRCVHVETHPQTSILVHNSRIAALLLFSFKKLVKLIVNDTWCQPSKSLYRLVDKLRKLPYLHAALLLFTNSLLTLINLLGVLQVVFQTIPTMVPATAENGDKITVQLAKIITIPAHQLAQCQLQTSTGTNKPSVTASPAGISLLHQPLTVRALAPVNVAPGAQVMRLTVPTQTQQQTLVVSQAGGSAGVVTVSEASQTVTAQPQLISSVINGSDLVIGAPASGAMEKLKAAGVQVQAVPVAVQQNQINSKVIQNIKSDVVDAEVVIKLETPDVTIKTEEPEC